MLARDGAVVLIDPVSVNYMAGSQIDFVDDLIGAVVQDQQSAGHRELRLRDELFALSWRQLRLQPAALANVA